MDNTNADITIVVVVRNCDCDVIDSDGRVVMVGKSMVEGDGEKDG